jgi:Mg2+/Co2+ transporter CorB
MENRVESASLLALVILCLINLQKATYISAAVTPSGPIVQLMGILEWIEVCILLIFPVVTILTLIVSLLMYPFKKFCNQKSNASTTEEQQSLLKDEE